MNTDPVDLDAMVRLRTYQRIVDTGCTPLMADVAKLLSLSIPEVKSSFERLADGKALVLQPESGEILMAEPFSAVPTSFVVEVGEKKWWGNCIWDSLSVLAMLGKDGTVRTACGDCGESMTLEVRNGRLQKASGVIHFLLPTNQWWKDVVFT